MWIDPCFRQQGIAKYKELKDDGKFEGLTRVQIIKLLRSETGLGLAECSSIYRELNTMTILLDKLTDDKTVIGNILTGLKMKGGYCPCKIGIEAENLCPSKEYRDTGHRLCQLYKNAKIYITRSCLWIVRSCDYSRERTRSTREVLRRKR